MQLQLLKTTFAWLKYTLSFIRNALYQTWKAFNTKFGPQWKDQKISYQVKPILTFFRKLVVKG